MKRLHVNEIVQSVSITHPFNKPALMAINTGDIENGKILNAFLTPVAELKGQFKKTIQNGDILFSEIRPANRRFARVEGLTDASDYVVSTKLMVLRQYNDDVDPEYFYYWLTNQSFLNVLQMRAENRICSFPQITFEILSEYVVPVPDISEQKKIASILKAIDEKIANNNSICSDLESMAKLLYDYWFVQFDFPDENGKPYKSSGGKMVWNEELKREIPEGWKVSSISKILGNYPKTESVMRDNYSDGTKFPIIDQSKNFICGYTDDKNKVLNIQDAIVFGDHTNISKYINFPFARGADGTQIIVSNSDSLSNYLLYLQIQSLPVIEEGYSRHYKFLKEQKIIIPQKQVNEGFSEYISPALNIIRKSIEENYLLTSLRDFLLPMLMNGQVKVK